MATEPTEQEFAAAMAHVAKMERAVASGADPRTLKNLKGLTFDEFVKAAGWTQAAKHNKLSGLGFDTAETQWQMGMDPEEILADHKRDAERMLEWHERPEREHRAKVQAEMEAARRKAELHALGAHVNRSMLAGLPPLSPAARAAVLQDELDEIMGRTVRRKAERGFTELEAMGALAVGTVSFVGGRKLNATYGQITPLKLLPSSAAALASGVVAIVTHQARWKKASRAALAAVVGMSGATLAEHIVPKRGVLKQET